MTDRRSGLPHSSTTRAVVRFAARAARVPALDVQFAAQVAAPVNVQDSAQAVA